MDISYDNMTITELKNLCKNRNIKRYSKLNKSELIELLTKNITTIDHKPTRKPIRKQIRNQLWLKTFGENFNGNCYCCNTNITTMDFHAGHIISVNNGGKDELDNLRCVCSLCNQSMSIMNMEEFKNSITINSIKPINNICKMCKGNGYILTSEQVPRTNITQGYGSSRVIQVPCVLCIKKVKNCIYW